MGLCSYSQACSAVITAAAQTSTWNWGCQKPVACCKDRYSVQRRDYEPSSTVLNHFYFNSFIIAVKSAVLICKWTLNPYDNDDDDNDVLTSSLAEWCDHIINPRKSKCVKCNSSHCTIGPNHQLNQTKSKHSDLVLWL